jgi:hypothetical protein
VVELDYAFVRPEPSPNLLARYNFARGFEEQLEDLERLILEPNPPSLFAQFTSLRIQLEWPEAHI